MKGLKMPDAWAERSVGRWAAAAALAASIAVAAPALAQDSGIDTGVVAPAAKVQTLDGKEAPC
jgi:hypothetical protein